MIILSLILFLLVFILLLFKIVSIRIIYSSELRIELEFYPFLFVLQDINKSKKKSNIKFRLVFKRIVKLIRGSTVKVKSLPPRTDSHSASLTHGIFYSLIYPLLAYLSANTKTLSADKKQDGDNNTLDITLDIRLYLIAKELILFVFDIAKEKLSGKHA